MKRSSSVIIIAVLLVLVGLSVWLYLSKSKPTTVDNDDRAFAYKDTAAITRIFIADKDNHQSEIKRTKNGWIVNNKYPCRSDAILNLLEVIKLVEVKMPVPKAGKDNVIKLMSFNALKVEIYAGDEKVKQYYVGHETSDGLGSYMLLTNLDNDKNYKDPYICFIPGFQGYLQPRFIAEENDWRERIVMNFIPPQMKSITVQHLEWPADSSFKIELPGINNFKLTDLNGHQKTFDDEKMRQYLVYYQNLSYEVLMTGRNTSLQDSLSQRKPFTVVTVELKDNKTEVFKFYRKQYTGEQPAEQNIPYEFDPDRLYLNFDGGRQWALGQYFVFGKLFMTPTYFSPPGSVKK